MPSTAKTIHFMSSALVTSISVAILGYGMSAKWAQISMDCGQRGSETFSGNAKITMDLFNGNLNRQSCPVVGGGDLPFEVFPQLSTIKEAPLILHALVVCLLILCLLFSAVSILISLYNSVSNPYQTYMGPIGVYTCSSLSACLSFLVLILFVVNINVTTMAEDLVENVAESPVATRNKVAVMQTGYFLLIPYTVLSLIAIALIYKYEHAAYTHRREQERPTEDAPKEIMMY
ncbi:hypothetical protein LDENG_00076990 [Lucifuga dentata]|nr:hypothetical protein LDENG_00076990 [Lucifuga dentata]